METEIISIKEDLKVVCSDFVELLKRLEHHDLITHEEYINYSKRKIDFLDIGAKSEFE